MDLSREALWQGVLKRDRQYEGICFYGVKSTFIYCRFECPSKKPNRENTRFFFSREGAEEAGYRPCKRCRPDISEVPVQNGTLAKVLRVCRYIESCDYVPTLKELAQKIKWSPFYLQRVFKSSLGLTPRNFADAHRQQRFRNALKGGEGIAMATYDAGYGSSSRVYEKSSRYLGMTPKAYTEHGKGHEIHYSVLKCPLGYLLLAATKKGICSVRIGHTPSAMVDALEREFKNADIHESHSELSKWSQMLIDYLAGHIPWPRLPYDIRATAFQRKVWDYLRTIPEGQTMHYSEIAAAIGRPKAARAVARAVGSNPVAIVIPCHRVVPKSGGVGGYRWGPERKKKLLSIEKHKS
jgi:AraC family transcriptional regulator of adaptative response/methylated-DNA-[protein]-cysteine methyltransferase